MKKLSPYILILLLGSLVSYVALGMNYNNAVIQILHHPETSEPYGDGIGISNKISSWMLGEDFWSLERFRHAYEISEVVLVIFFVLYIIAVLWEEVIRRKTK